MGSWICLGGLKNAPASSVTFDYYISTTGSDSNAGTQGSPWAITAINTKRATYAGKRVGLLDGTYYLATLGTGKTDPDQLLLNPASGSFGSPTVIQAVNPRQAILDGTDGAGNRVNAYFTGNGCGLIGQTYLNAGDSGYVELRDLVIRKGYRYLVHFRYSAAPIAAASGSRFPGVVVDGCDISDLHNDNRGLGDNIALIMAYTTQGMIVNNCRLYNARGDRVANDANGYGFQSWSANDTTLSNCTILNCKDGIYVKNQAQTGVTVYNCYIDLTAYTGAGTTNALYGCDFADGSTQHVLAHHNVMIAKNGVRVHDLSTILKGPCQYYNNTIVALGTDFNVCGLQIPGGSQNVQFYNNIIWRSGSTSASDDGDILVSTTNPTTKGNYNSYPVNPKFKRDSNSDGVSDGTSYSSVATWSAASGFDAAGISGDPLFVGSGADALAYQLQGGSPCKNTGRSDGTSGGTACDMGAWGGASPPSTVGSSF